MKKYVIFALSAYLFVSALASCDEHEPIDLDIHPGYVLCDDGSIVSADNFPPAHRTAVAVVFASKTESHEVLAVLLDELPPVAFCDTLGMNQGTSCDEAAFDGYVNTVSMQTTYRSRDTLVVKDDKAAAENYYSSPLANYAFRSHWFQQSDYIPSVAEMGLLYLARDVVNPIIERFGGTPLSTDSRGCWYWTSTEVKQNQPNQSWLFSMSDGSRHKAPKTNSYRARLIVEYNPLNVKK